MMKDNETIGKTEDDFIREVAEEEGLTFEEVKESVEQFKGMMSQSPSRATKPKHNKAKAKIKRKMARNSRKINR